MYVFLLNLAVWWRGEGVGEERGWEKRSWRRGVEEDGGIGKSELKRYLTVNVNELEV